MATTTQTQLDSDLAALEPLEAAYLNAVAAVTADQTQLSTDQTTQANATPPYVAQLLVVATDVVNILATLSGGTAALQALASTINGVLNPPTPPASTTK